MFGDINAAFGDIMHSSIMFVVVNVLFLIRGKPTCPYKIQVHGGLGR